MIENLSKPLRLKLPLRFFASIAVAFFFIFLFSFKSNAQVALDFSDTTPTLEVGSPLQQGARYRFDNVAPGTDALVTLTTITSGAQLVALDNNTGSAARFQPIIYSTAANSAHYVRFDFQLVTAGGTTPKAVPGVRISAQDVDGTTGSALEFIEFGGMQSVSVNSPTYLVAKNSVLITPSPNPPVSYRQGTSGGNQNGIGTDNRYEVYGVLGNTTSSFTIIGGNVIGSSGCSGAIGTNNCDRLNSYTFDPVSANSPAVSADLSITKTGPATVNQGGTVQYTLTARNLSGTAANGATVTDNVPAALSSVSISCSASGSAVCPTTTGLTTISNLMISTFPVGGQLVFTVTGTAPNSGTLTNVATIAIPQGGTDTNANNNTSATITTTVLVPSLVITKSSNGHWTTEQTGAQYSLLVTNSGTASTSGTTTVLDALPAGITANWTGTRSVTSGGITWNCTFSGQTVTCTTTGVLSNTAGSNTSTITLPVNVTTSAAVGTNSVTNYASIGGGGDPYNSGNTPTPGADCTNTNHCTSNSTTVFSPDLTITKTHTGNFPRGSTGTYTITVTNSGTAATSGTITVSDSLPMGLSIADGTFTPGGTNGANWSCTAASNALNCTSTTAIAISGSSIFAFTVNVASNAPNSITNSVSVSGVNEATANNGNNSDDDTTTTIAGPPNVSLLKLWTSPTCSSDCETNAPPQLPGTDITYKIEFTNSGGQGASNLRIIDGIPDNMDYKIGMATAVSGITFTIEFSDNYDPLNPTLATWGYTPISQGGGAPVGYDRLVKAIRWSANATIPNTSPNNTGYVNFVAKIR